MKSPTIEASVWAVRGLYLFAFILVFWPMADLVTNTMPIQLSNVRWRYGVAGLMAGFLHTPILGLVLATGVALWRESARTLRAIAILEVVGACILVIVMAMFALDGVQVRPMPEGSLPSFATGAGISEAKHLTAFLALLFLGIGSWKMAAEIAAIPAPKSPPAAGIVAQSGRALP